MCAVSVSPWSATSSSDPTTGSSRTSVSTFIVTAAREESRRPVVVSHELGLEFAWVPLTELGRVTLVPPTLDILIRRALAGDLALYVTYDCRRDPDEQAGTHIWP